MFDAVFQHLKGFWLYLFTAIAHTYWFFLYKVISFSQLKMKERSSAYNELLVLKSLLLMAKLSQLETLCEEIKVFVVSKMTRGDSHFLENNPLFECVLNVMNRIC